MIWILCFAVLAWWAVGVVGFIFGLTREYDLTTRELVGLLIVGLLGPLAWLIGAAIHSKSRLDTVLIRRRA